MTLAALRQQGLSLRQIAAVLDRNPSKLSRELRRNAKGGEYISSAAQAASAGRQ